MTVMRDVPAVAKMEALRFLTADEVSIVALTDRHWAKLVDADPSPKVLNVNMGGPEMRITDDADAKKIISLEFPVNSDEYEIAFFYRWFPVPPNRALFHTSTEFVRAAVSSTRPTIIRMWRAHSLSPSPAHMERLIDEIFPTDNNLVIKSMKIDFPTFGYRIPDFSCLIKLYRRLNGEQLQMTDHHFNHLYRCVEYGEKDLHLRIHTSSDAAIYNAHYDFGRANHNLLKYLHNQTGGLVVSEMQASNWTHLPGYLKNAVETMISENKREKFGDKLDVLFTYSYKHTTIPAAKIAAEALNADWGDIGEAVETGKEMIIDHSHERYRHGNYDVYNVDDLALFVSKKHFGAIRITKLK